MIGPTNDLIVKFSQDHDITGQVLDVGALDINGNIRRFFPNYIGIDMQSGPNVDKVMNAHDIKKEFKKETFDIVCCFDTLEHDDRFWITVENMKWVLKRGGWLLVGAPSIHHGRHNHPFDFYRFTGEAFKQYIFSGMNNVFVEEQYYNKPGDIDYSEDRPDQVYGWGQKK